MLRCVPELKGGAGRDEGPQHQHCGAGNAGRVACCCGPGQAGELMGRERGRDVADGGRESTRGRKAFVSARETPPVHLEREARALICLYA